MASDYILNKGLPSNIDAEKFILGSCLLDKSMVEQTLSSLQTEDFALEAHRRIFDAFQSLQVKGEVVDRVTVANELKRIGHLESVGGVTYIVSLDEGLPQLSSIESYVRIVREHSSRRRIILFSQKAIELAVSGGEDASSILSFLTESTADIDSRIDSGDKIQDFDSYLSKHKGGMDELLVRPTDMVPTGYPKLDEIIGGLMPGLLYIIGAETAYGKTALSLNIVESATSCGYPALYFSLEMGKAQIFRRLMFSRAQVSLGKYKYGSLSDVERYQLKAQGEELRKLPLYIDDSGNLSIMDVQTRLSSAIRDRNIQLAVIDYLQLMDYGDKEERIAIGMITRSMKQAAKHFNVPILLLSQLSRERGRRPGRDTRPKLKDFHGSSSIEKDSDVCILIHRPEFDDLSKTENKDVAEVIVAKQRDGPTGTVKMKFQGRFTRFVEDE